MFSEEPSPIPAAPIKTGPVPSSQAACASAESIRVHFDGFALVVTDGEAPGRHVQIGDAPVIIGRGAGVDLQISDPTVSRHHCVIWRASGRCWIRDLGSTNRTRVNDRPARIAELFENDVVLVGQTALTLAPSAVAQIAGDAVRTG
jgi:pSer/pThr/pTyr-binding forkhead associated (FHA) protein